MIICHLRNHIVIATITVIVSSLFACGAAASGQSATGAEEVLRQQLISLFQSGRSPSDLHSSHTLYPMGKTHSTAITTYLLLKNDPAMLERFYPLISRISMEIFKNDRVSPEGFIKGSGCIHSNDDIEFSPAVNGLAALELHALSLIASAAGKHEDAIELQEWSRHLSDLATKTFFDYDRGSFFPVSSSGHYLIIYSPEFLLPMVRDRVLSERTRAKIADRLIYNISRQRTVPGGAGTMWDDPTLRPMIYSLLSNITGFPVERLSTLCETPLQRNTVRPSIPAHKHWIEYWSRPGRARDLFPGWMTVPSLVHFSALVERESLLENEEAITLSSDLKKLLSLIEARETDLETHISSISLVNNLLVRIGKMSSRFDSGEKIWKIVEEIKWNRLSPRCRKLIARACHDSIDELMRAKVVLSTLMVKSTGIIADIQVPEQPVPLGHPVDIRASIRSSSIPLDISRIYLQISSNRWILTGNDEKIYVQAGEAPLKWDRLLTLPPGSLPGIVTLPLFFDFMLKGKRVEIHRIESIALTRGYDVSLDFPNGRRLTDGMAIPVNIILKYKSDHRIQGSVEGIFLKDMICDPELPARFVIDPEKEINVLPLKITSPDDPSPGKYPFTISVHLNGSKIAVFEEELTRPIQWLHLGPVKNRRWALEEAVQLQDDLHSTYMSPDGRELRWRSVAPGAIDAKGAIMPDRLYGSGSNRCMLLYTIVTLPATTMVKWQIDTDNITSLWINSTEVITGTTDSSLYSGTASLRKGRNAILVSSYWPQAPGTVLFKISDKSGLPVPGLSNQMEEMATKFAALMDNKPHGDSNADADDQPRELIFELLYPEASEVSVIAEFNNWAPEATPMARMPDGRWTAALILPQGRYQYRFLVDRKLKINDPSNNNLEPDGFGGYNSVLIVK